MKTFLRIVILVVILATITSPAYAAEEGPLAIMGEVNYSSLGTAKLEGTPANIYEEFLEGKLVNAGIPMGDKEGVAKKFAEAENKFWGYKMYDTDLPEPKYRVDASVNVRRTRYGEDNNRQDISVVVRIFDIKTGKLVGQTTESRRDVDPNANLQIVGPQPTWWERYASGYTREIKYDNPLKEAIDKASQTVVGKLLELGSQKVESDADRFLRFIEQNQVEQQQIKSDEESTETDQENAGSKNITCEQSKKIINKEKCPHWVRIEPGNNSPDIMEISGKHSIWCFFDVGTVTDVGTSTDKAIRSRPPDYTMDPSEWDKCNE